MSCASIIRAASLYVLAAVKTPLPLYDQVIGATPPSSTSVTPTDPPLDVTSGSTAAVRNSGSRDTVSEAVATRWWIAAAVKVTEGVRAGEDLADRASTCKGAAVRSRAPAAMSTALADLRTMSPTLRLMAETFLCGRKENA